MPAVISNNKMTSAVALIAGSFLAVSVASADTQIPDLTFDIQAGGQGNSFLSSEFGSSWSNPNGTYSYDGSQEFGGFDFGWNVLAGAGDFPASVIANFVVTNNSGADQTFSITVNSAPLATPGGVDLASTLIGGSVTGSVTDLNGDGASLSAVSPDGSLYSALFNTDTVATLGDDPFSASAGVFESNTVGPEEFGSPIPSAVGPAFANGDSIGITLEFVLSAGDSASFTSVFVVDVPAPAGLALLGVAGVVSRRRRRA